MKIRQLALAALGLLALSAAAGAYVLNGPKWGISQIPYYINPVNGDMSETDAITAIQSAAMNWTSQSNAAISLYYMGRTAGSSLTKNDRNEVFFRNASAGSTAAEVYWWYDSTYRLVEADMVFYDGGFKFFPGSSGCASGLYLEDVATHEFGHVLGLGHSSVSTATMAPSVQWCSMATRSLDGDDLAGVEALYPSGGTNTAPSVSITSPANGATVAEGTPILFAGSAADQEDGPLSGSLLWLSSRDGQIGSGASFTRVLSAGGHTITARVTDSKGVTTESRRTIAVDTVALPPASAFALSARGYKVKGQQRADLTWEGSSATSIDVYRNGGRIATVANLGRYTDALNVKGGGTYSYKVCAAGSSTCSNTTTIVF